MDKTPAEGNIFLKRSHSLCKHCTTPTWYSKAVSYYSIYIDANFTPNLGETKSIKIIALAGGRGVENLQVNGYMLKPDDNTEVMDFYEIGDGNYIGNFRFEQNGVYTLYVMASDTNKNTAIASECFYCGAYTISIIPVGNNIFSPGENATLMFFVSATKPLKHAEGTITIWYPTGGILSNKAKLVELSTPGYYAYSLTMPSVLGEYKYSVNIRLGQNKADYNGIFKVTAALVCGNGLCESGENCKNCPQDCGDCGPGGGGGGAVGGGATPMPTKTPEVFVKPEVFIRDINIEPLKIGSPAIISGIIDNNSDKKIDVIVSVIIRQEAQLEYVDERTYLGIAPFSKQKFSMLLPWTPETSGLHVMSVTVYSIDKSTKLATEVKLIELGGELRYDLSALCTTPVVTAGTVAYFDVSAYNVGTYYTDVMLSWSIEDSSGKAYLSSSTPIAIKPGGKTDKHIVETIPESLPSGTYFFRAKLSVVSADSNFQQREAVCAFYVTKREKADYSLTLFELGQRIQKAKSKIRALKAKGFEVSEVEDEAKKLEQELSSFEEKVQKNELESPSTILVQLSMRISVLEDEIESFESNSKDQQNLIFNTLLVMTILLVAPLFSFYCAIKNERSRGKALEAQVRNQIVKIRELKAHHVFKSQHNVKHTMHR
ncbi:MAG: hypothetical protein QXM75_00875 [Candidatus Diapherotrites archaeon]